MIDPNSPNYAAWAKVQRELAEKCRKLQSELDMARTARARWNEVEERQQMSAYTVAQLRAKYEDRGPKGRSFARSARKTELIDALVGSDLIDLEERIVRIEQLLEENQPSPYWKEE